MISLPGKCWLIISFVLFAYLPESLDTELRDEDDDDDDDDIAFWQCTWSVWFNRRQVNNVTRIGDKNVDTDEDIVCVFVCRFKKSNEMNKSVSLTRWPQK